MAYGKLTHLLKDWKILSLLHDILVSLRIWLSIEWVDIAFLRIAVDGSAM